MPYTPEEIARKTSETIRAKALAALRPIQREMQLMGWGPGLRFTMWMSVMRIALDRMTEVQTRSGGPESGREPAGAGLDVGEWELRTSAIQSG